MTALKFCFATIISVWLQPRALDQRVLEPVLRLRTYRCQPGCCYFMEFSCFVQYR
jgi:hypothetical protein